MFFTLLFASEYQPPNIQEKRAMLHHLAPLREGALRAEGKIFMNTPGCRQFEELSENQINQEFERLRGAAEKAKIVQSRQNGRIIQTIYIGEPDTDVHHYLCPREFEILLSLAFGGTTGFQNSFGISPSEIEFSTENWRIFPHLRQ